MYTKSNFEAMTKKELIGIIVEANDSYYNKTESIISDEEYDIARDVMKERFPNEPINIQIGAPLGVSEWKKAKHDIPMTSLNKVNTVEEFRKWIDTIGDESYLLMDKLDGLSIETVYENGKLVKAITRGDDGIIGEDILSNVRNMKNVKKEIVGYTGSLRGEIVMLIDDFEKHNKALKSIGEKEKSNPRNTAGGIAKRYDGKFSEYCTVLFYDATGEFNSEESKIEFLKYKGIKTSFAVKVNQHQCEVYYTEYEKHLRSSTPYDIDGLVIKANTLSLQNKLGKLNNNPKAQIAWKFTSMKTETTIEGIEWSMGQNRRITPVALLKPVKVGGVVVARASLHNLKMFNDFKLGRGDVVQISRRNDVIPYVESIVKKNSNINFKPPMSCPACGEELVQGDTYLSCPNDHCEALVKGNLNKWVQALGVMDISFKTIEALVNKKLIKEPADFYGLKVDQIKTLEGFADKSANKIVDSFKKHKIIPLEIFIDGLNMDMFSKSRAETLIENGYDTLEKMQKATVDDLVKIAGIGETVANSIVTGLQNKFMVILGLLSVGVNIGEKEMPKKIEATGSSLIGKSFCFTGAINRIDDNGKRFTRDMMQELVVENGGSTMDSVKKGLSFLVQADPSSTSSKSKKANDLDIEILSEADFFKMIGM